ncbi:hypothetical protein [Lacrimispora sphenoides]|uniref:hypothetical protein n=1 Tax=Lacrimispora sphenoides TaxID=29370 RepID=UPI00115FA4D7|nr:hypothetical protein [Lacrimispora sphenoides]
MIDDLHAELERIIKRDGHGKTWILCGSENVSDNNDKVIDHIARKPIGFDESNSFCYVLCTKEAGKGCMKYTRENSR